MGIDGDLVADSAGQARQRRLRIGADEEHAPAARASLAQRLAAAGEIAAGHERRCIQATVTTTRPATAAAIHPVGR